MQFDEGEVLPGLNENWTFMGANALEWAIGLVVFITIGSCARTPASAMPLMLIGWVLTTTTLATTRRAFPDEERGTRNAVMSACGFEPPGIPSPAILQPIWSGAPQKEINEESKFMKLDLHALFPSRTEVFFDPEV